MKRIYVVLVVAVIALFSVSCQKEALVDEPASVEPASYTAVDVAILAKVNEYRASVNKSALVMVPAIWNTSNKHSVDMSNNLVEIGHTDFAERASALRLKVKPAGEGVVAENVAMVSNSVLDRVVQLWLESPDHKKNIDGDYLYTGISAVQDATKQHYYITQLFYR
jgi:uncharacterized protein YkwD